VDRSKPGHRKIVALFLVDPQVPIPSTSEVAPQQGDLVLEAMRSAPTESKLHLLPTELLDMILDNMDGVMTLDAAKELRLKLMDERTVFVDKSNKNYFELSFSMCEQ
jgi:hypothetical protein